MTDHVPTTTQVEVAFVAGYANPLGGLTDVAAQREFRAWLRDHEAEVLERAAKALRKGIKSHGTYEAAGWLEDRALKIAEGELTDE